MIKDMTTYIAIAEYLAMGGVIDKDTPVSEWDMYGGGYTKVGKFTGEHNGVVTVFTDLGYTPLSSTLCDIQIPVIPAFAIERLVANYESYIGVHKKEMEEAERICDDVSAIMPRVMVGDYETVVDDLKNLKK